MAGIPVNNNLNALTNIVNQAANVSGSQNAPYMNASYGRQEEALQDTFNMIMNRVGTQVSNNVGTQGNSQTIAKAAAAGVKTMSTNIGTDYSGQTTVKGSAASDSKHAAEAADNTAKRTEENSAGTEETTEAVKGTENEVSEGKEEAVKDAGEKLVEEVAKEMDVTPEEVEEVMEVLGLSAIQLLDPDNMKQLLIALSGNEDQLAIVTDAELYGHYQNLLDTAADILDTLQTELGLSEEELSTLIADMAVVEKAPEEMDAVEELLTQPKEAENVNLEGMKDYAVTVHKDGETVAVKVTVNDADGSQSVQEETTAVSEAQPKHDAKSGNRNSFGEGRNEGNAAGNFMMQTPVLQPDVNEIVGQQPVMDRFVNTQDIMDQIMEYMKINLKSDVQELELQLHPASLGNVNVQIAAKDGAITAQFTAQNDIVKAAIESQLVQLKAQFEEQGIKVDAVEVTVADYHFEQNFSGNEENAGEEKAGGKKNQRRINLNELDLDDLPEDMDDSERIAAEMMAASGSTVDYSA